MINPKDSASSLLNRTKRLQTCLAAVVDSCNDSGSADFRDSVGAALIRSEVLTNGVRDFASRMLPPPAFEHVTETLDRYRSISVADCAMGAIRIRFPGLLPHRKHRDKGFITLPLGQALKKYLGVFLKICG